MNKELLKNIISGILIGVANIIPGVSGGSIALSLGIFDKLIYSINSVLNSFLSFKFFKNKQEFVYLLKIGIGIVIGIFGFAKIVSYFLNTYPSYTIFFFVGLILSSVPTVIRMLENKTNIKNYFFLLLGISIVIWISFLKPDKGDLEINILLYFKLFFIAIIAASFMVLPGISGSFILLVFGYYQFIIDALTFKFSYMSLKILFVFGIGVIVGIVFIVKLLNLLFERFKDFILFFILGLVIGSIYIIWPANIETGFLNIILYLIFTFFGFILVLGINK